jgi:hypothetical protein
LWKLTDISRRVTVISVVALAVALSSDRALAEENDGLRQGSRMFSFGASYIAGIDERADIGSADVSFDQFVTKNLSLGLQATALGVSQEGDDAIGVSLAVDFRHHPFTWNGGSVYVDGFFGPVEMSARVPAGGTRFNFISRIGPGVMLKIDDAEYVMVGARYWHLSNAQIEGAHRNPAINGVQLYFSVAHQW